MEKIKWVDLQKHIKLVFGEYQVKNFKDTVEKDNNGWNWILSFEDLRAVDTIIIHTKFIFKLDKDQVHLRKNEFLYLVGLNTRYRLVKFKDLKELETLLFKILREDLFNKDIIELSNFLITPEQDVNDYFVKKNIQGFSVFDIQFKPTGKIKNVEFKFLCNVNNNQEFTFTIKKENDIKYTFKYSDKVFIIKEPDFSNISEVIGKFIAQTLDKF